MLALARAGANLREGLVTCISIFALHWAPPSPAGCAPQLPSLLHLLVTTTCLPSSPLQHQGQGDCADAQGAHGLTAALSRQPTCSDSCVQLLVTCYVPLCPHSSVWVLTAGGFTAKQKWREEGKVLWVWPERRMEEGVREYNKHVGTSSVCA